MGTDMVVVYFKKYWWEVILIVLIFLMVQGKLLEGAYKAGYRDAVKETR